jgi:hypothetical protein
MISKIWTRQVSMVSQEYVLDCSSRPGIVKELASATHPVYGQAKMDPKVYESSLPGFDTIGQS